MIDIAQEEFFTKKSTSKQGQSTSIFGPLSHLTTQQIIDEAVDIIAAGSDTTATALGNLFVHVLKSPRITRKLVAEIDQAMPDRSQACSLAKLEQLEYLVSWVHTQANMLALLTYLAPSPPALRRHFASHHRLFLDYPVWYPL